LDWVGKCRKCDIHWKSLDQLKDAKKAKVVAAFSQKLQSTRKNLKLGGIHESEADENSFSKVRQSIMDCKTAAEQILSAGKITSLGDCDALSEQINDLNATLQMLQVRLQEERRKAAEDAATPKTPRGVTPTTPRVMVECASLSSIREVTEEMSCRQGSRDSGGTFESLMSRQESNQIRTPGRVMSRQESTQSPPSQSASKDSSKWTLEQSKDSSSKWSQSLKHSSSIMSLFRRSSVTYQFQMGSRVEVNVKDQWLPGTVVGLPPDDKSNWSRYCVQCDAEEPGGAEFGRVMASLKMLRDVDTISFQSTASDFSRESTTSDLLDVEVMEAAQVIGARQESDTLGIDASIDTPTFDSSVDYYYI
jgi:hypothetical protein